MDHPNLPFGFALPGHAHMQIPPTPNLMSGHPGPTSSPPQSVPGRRTPLGAVGLGGFYAQGLGMSQQGSLPTDENKPSPSALAASGGAMGHGHKSPLQSISGGTTTVAASSGTSGGAGGGKQKNRQAKTVRLNINARFVIVNMFFMPY